MAGRVGVMESRKGFTGLKSVARPVERDRCARSLPALFRKLQ